MDPESNYRNSKAILLLPPPISSSSIRRNVSRSVAFPNSSRRASAASARNQHSMSPTKYRMGKNVGSEGSTLRDTEDQRAADGGAEGCAARGGRGSNDGHSDGSGGSTALNGDVILRSHSGGGPKKERKKKKKKRRESSGGEGIEQSIISEDQSYAGSDRRGEGREDEDGSKKSKQTSRKNKSSHQRSRRRAETLWKNNQPLPSSAFVPKNPSCNMIQQMFMDVKTADVVFELDEKRGTRYERVNFYAHRCILQQCAPQLAELCGLGGDGPTSVSIKNVKPRSFYYLLSYLYGLNVPEKELVANAKGLIDAADRYGISSLKLETEVCFVESRKISFENMMKYLLYAEATNCALLKEAVMDFMVENKVEVLENVALKDAPEGLLADVLAAMARGEKKGATGIAKETIQLSTLRISDLRRRSHEKGLDVDVPREALIAALKNSSEISSLEYYKR